MTDTPKNSWDESIKTMLYAILLAIVFRSFLYEPFHIPSGSMEDTLLVGDYIFVSKYSYGYSRYSFPLGLPLFEGRILQPDKPERGDVVVFRPKTQPRVDFIKRVIGLPGDRIQMRDNQLYINDELVKREKLDETFIEQLDNGLNFEVTRYEETLPNGVTHHVLDRGTMMPIPGEVDVDNTAVYRVPSGQYFMMGDNRDNSRDSRYLDEIGFVPEENIVGRAEIIMFSIGDDARFWELWKWPTALRWSRFFTLID